MPRLPIYRRLVLGLAGLFLLLGTAQAGTPVPRHPVVVELFTSQGCDSCPPADAILGQLAERKDVIALSLPVTYWDMLGWKDTLASDTDTRRQKSYAEAMGHGGVFTPEIIVDGTTDVVGGRQQTIDAAIAAHLGDDGAHVKLSETPGEIHISVAASATPIPNNATIWLMHVLSRATVKIASGENGGRTITYRNVVREIKSVGLWKGQAVSLDLPRNDGGAPAYDTVVVLVQGGNGYGRILGAAMTGGQSW